MRTETEPEAQNKTKKLFLADTQKSKLVSKEANIFHAFDAILDSNSLVEMRIDIGTNRREVEILYANCI